MAIFQKKIRKSGGRVGPLRYILGWRVAFKSPPRPHPGPTPWVYVCWKLIIVKAFKFQFIKLQVWFAKLILSSHPNQSAFTNCKISTKVFSTFFFDIFWGSLSWICLEFKNNIFRELTTSFKKLKKAFLSKQKLNVKNLKQKCQVI